MWRIRRVGAVLALCAAAMPAVAETWRVTKLGDEVVLAAPEVSFSASGRVSIATGCNTIAFAARVEVGTLVAEGPLISTRMACDAGLDRQERAFATLFGDTVALSYDPFADRLTLTGGGLTATLMRASEAVPDEPERAVWRPHAGREPPAADPPYLAVAERAEDLPVRAGPSGESEALGAVASGTVLRNAGCEDDWCAVDLPDGSLAGWAEAEWLAPAESALRAAQGVHDETALLPCAMGHGVPMGKCNAGIARDAGGTAALVVLRPDDMKRMLFFEAGSFAGADASLATGGFDADAQREAGMTRVRVDDEYYEVPDRLLFGR